MTALPQSIVDCFQCKCSNAKTKYHLNVLARKAANATSFEAQDRITRQMEILADCMDSNAEISRGKWSVFLTMMLGLIVSVVLVLMVRRVVVSRLNIVVDEDHPIGVVDTLVTLGSMLLLMFVLGSIFMRF